MAIGRLSVLTVVVRSNTRHLRSHRESPPSGVFTLSFTSSLSELKRHTSLVRTTTCSELPGVLPLTTDARQSNWWTETACAIAQRLTCRLYESGIGQLSPSRPRNPTRSSSRCKMFRRSPARRNCVQGQQSAKMHSFLAETDLGRVMISAQCPSLPIATVVETLFHGRRPERCPNSQDSALTTVRFGIPLERLDRTAA